MAARTILMTGCSSGIGLASAQALKARGWRVLATCRKAEDAARLEREGFESWALDHADEASVAAGAAEALARAEGRLDAVFLNGAWALAGPAEDTPREAMEAIFAANLFGPVQLANAVIPAMRRAGRGRVVFCSSVLGMVAARYRGPYVSTKFAMEGWADALRMELKGSGVEVTLIEPGPILTPFRRNVRPNYERWMRPARAASLHPEEMWAIVERRLYKDKEGGRFDLPPEAVAAKLVSALEAERAPARVFVTTPTYLANLFRRLLPTRALDRVMGGR
ncbi:MAG: SDR family NAD(P)-dependent oxidoreductase [Pikeienuella sp.]|uniref:SDR family NAD(P)-dependent oxidoreductase n=1 Tax=Pikeienuella sp. TaxID=2831957 RepID=UPI00391C88B1